MKKILMLSGTIVAATRACLDVKAERQKAGKYGSLQLQQLSFLSLLDDFYFDM